MPKQPIHLFKNTSFIKVNTDPKQVFKNMSKSIRPPQTEFYFGSIFFATWQKCRPKFWRVNNCRKINLFLDPLTSLPLIAWAKK